MLETSVIVRTKNEEKYIKNVLEILRNQTYQNFEIIIVDDNSTDKTIEIVKKYNTKIVEILLGKFSHPYSCNLGAKEAKGKYLVFLNGHSIPISKKWLERGVKNFKKEKIAGIYSLNLAHKKSTLIDKFIFNFSGYTIGLFKFKSHKSSLGLLQTTSAIIRKDLWQKHCFQENVNQGMGGEDREWALYFMKRGYKIIHDPKFKVRHSHHLKIKDFFWQLKNWYRMANKNLKNIPEIQRKNF